jgi:hypothetical protein
VLALAEGGDIAPHEAQDTSRARLRLADAEDNLSALKVALERLKAESEKAEDAYVRSQRHMDACIRNVGQMEDVERLIATASMLKEKLEGVNRALRYINSNLVTDDSPTRRLVIGLCTVLCI